MPALAEPDAKLKQWAAERIAALLQMSPGDCGEIVENILMYENQEELKAFLQPFAAESAAEYKILHFIEDLFDRRKHAVGTGPKGGDVEVEVGDGRGTGRGRGRGRGEQDDGKGRGRRGGPSKENSSPKLNMPMRVKDKLDKRLLVLDAASGRHKILTNCLNCGKVIAESEGWGPCLFCGNPLEFHDQQGAKHGDARGYMESVGSIANTEEDRFNESYIRAVETKDRLLSYERDEKKRTKVFDDATDYYSESQNPWLTDAQREDALRRSKEDEKRLREEKRKIHATIDFVGRTVISTDAQIQAEMKERNKEEFQQWTEDTKSKTRLLNMMSSEEAGMSGARNHLSSDSKELYDRLRSSLHATGRNMQQNWKPKENAKKNTRWDASADNDRVGDDLLTGAASTAFLEPSNDTTRLLPAEESPHTDAEDTGQTLSMHQPWASLLVHGFKRAEGRMWKSDYRGRLWIHAAAKVPGEFEIETLEMEYRSFYEAHKISIPPLPSQCGGYPTSVLLGCVDVEEVWRNSEYRSVQAAHPNMPPEENDNEYIFWCMRPRRLLVPVKMGGDNKIWRLPRASLSAVQRGLHPVRWPVPEPGGQLLISPIAGRTVATSSKEDGGTTASTGSLVSRKPKPGSGFDLWPATAGENLQVVNRDGDAADRVVVLQDGFVHLAGFLRPDVQQRFVDELRELGLSEGGFSKEEGKTRMSFGGRWHHSSQKWEICSGKPGGPAHIPKSLLDLYSEAVKRANRELGNARNKKRKFALFPDARLPSLAVAEFSAPSTSSQLDQEEEVTVEGCAVLGVFFGEACEFAYSSEPPDASSHKPKVVRMESGDVYLIGGTSQRLWHGVNRLIPRTAPPSLRLIPGQLSLTLRCL